MSNETDAVDEAIMALLRDDGRISYRQIGRQLDVSESTVRQRMRRLQSGQAVRVGVVVDLTRTGRGVVAWLRISVVPAQRRATIERLVAMAETTYVATASGQHNVIAVLSAENVGALQRIVDDGISTAPGVHAVDVRIAGATIKHDFHEVCLRTD